MTKSTKISTTVSLTKLLHMCKIPMSVIDVPILVAVILGGFKKTSVPLQIGRGYEKELMIFMLILEVRREADDKTYHSFIKRGAIQTHGLIFGGVDCF